MKVFGPIGGGFVLLDGFAFGGGFGQGHIRADGLGKQEVGKVGAKLVDDVFAEFAVGVVAIEQDAQQSQIGVGVVVNVVQECFDAACAVQGEDFAFRNGDDVVRGGQGVNGHHVGGGGAINEDEVHERFNLGQGFSEFKLTPHHFLFQAVAVGGQVCGGGNDIQAMQGGFSGHGPDGGAVFKQVNDVDFGIHGVEVEGGIALFIYIHNDGFIPLEGQFRAQIHRRGRFAHPALGGAQRNLNGHSCGHCNRFLALIQG